MADIHILPTRAGYGSVDHSTELLSAAFKDGVDLGPRGPHIHALSLTLEENLIKLRVIADELSKSPVRHRLQLDTVESNILKLDECVTKLVAMTEVYQT